MVKERYIRENLKLMREKGFGMEQIRKLGIAKDAKEFAGYNPEVFKGMFKEKVKLIGEFKLSTFTDKELMGGILSARKNDLDHILKNAKLMKENGFNIRGAMGPELLFGPAEKIHELAKLVQEPAKKEPKTKKKVGWLRKILKRT